MPGKRRKGGGLWTVIAVAGVCAVAGIILLTYYGDRVPVGLKSIKPAKTAERAVVPEGPEAAFRDINIYFTDEDGLYLKAEKRRVKKAGIEAEAKDALRQLLNGPQDARLARAVPEGTRLKKFFIKNSTAYVDLSKEVMEKHQGGSEGELQTIYSIVNTVTLNFSEIKEVQIFIEGRTEATLAGHIDISYPLVADRKLIKG